MNEVIVLKAKRQINVVADNEITGDVKRVYSSVPLMLKAKRAINIPSDGEITGDVERSYEPGGFTLKAKRAINTPADRGIKADVERIWTTGGIRIKGKRLINVPADNEIQGDFIRIAFVTLDHMSERHNILLTVEQPYGIPWMQSEIVHSAWCWKLMRTDGVVLGFTSHDQDIVYNGVTYKAATGFAPSAVSTSGDMAVDNLDAEGMLRGDSITAEDLRKGLYTNAAIEVFLINYQNIKDEVFLMRKGTLGEVTYGKNGFKAEIRGLMEAYQQQTGKVYQKSCRTNLGSRECGMYLPNLTFSGYVKGIQEDGSFVIDVKQAEDYFSYGVIAFTSGKNAGSQMEIKKYHANGRTELFLPLGESVGLGDIFTIVAGCDGNATTCRNRFHNLVNFRGEPYIIGNSYSASYPVSSSNNIVSEGEDVRVGAYKWE